MMLIKDFVNQGFKNWYSYRQEGSNANIYRARILELLDPEMEVADINESHIANMVESLKADGHANIVINQILGMLQRFDATYGENLKLLRINIPDFHLIHLSVLPKTRSKKEADIEEELVEDDE